ncbi:MAG: serine hydrolase domain-containing protein [Bradyrhizobium sp.]
MPTSSPGRCLVACLCLAMAAGSVRADPLAAMRTDRQPGCAVAVWGATGARLDAAGFADVEAGLPITTRTRFLIASASKQFTALAVLALIDQGRLELDEPAQRRLPDLAGALQGATVRQLLNQTGGVRDHTTLMALAGIERMGEVAPDSIMTMMRGLDSNNFAPGSQARYSNGNYLVLAQLVERVSGHSLADYARDTIFVPLGMDDTGFDAGPPLAHGYQPIRAGGFRIADDQPSLPGSGGLVTTVEDLVRFDAAFRAGSGVLTERVKAMFLEPGRLRDGEVAVLPEFGTPYGAGVGLQRRDDVLWLSHDGGSEGFRAQYLRRVDTPVGTIVLCNRIDVNPTRIAESLLGLSTPRPERTSVASARDSPPLASEAEVARLVGRWRSQETFTDYVVRAVEGGVQVTIRSPLADEPVVEDWLGMSISHEGEFVTGPLRLKAEGDTLAVSFDGRIQELMFQRVDF